MKKILKCVSIVLTLCLLMSFGVFASEALTIEKIYPNPELKNSSGTLLTYAKNIGVNQGEIEIHFSKVLNPKNLQGITFVDGNGTAPIGGIELSAQEKVLKIKFGELTENTNYTLTVTTDFAALDGTSLTATKVLQYTTLPKEIADIDPVNDSALANYDRPFEKEPNTAAGQSVKIEGIGSNGALFNINNMKQDLAENTYFKREITPEGKAYIRFTFQSASGKNRFLRIGSLMKKDVGNVSSATPAAADFKVVTLLNYRLNDTSTSTNLNEGEFNKHSTPINDGGAIVTGPKVNDIHNAFVKVDDFYDSQMVSTKSQTETGTLTSKKQINVIDRTNGTIVKGSVNNTANEVTGLCWLALYAGGPYTGVLNADIAYAKSGYYMIPDAIRAPKFNYNTNALTVDFNTELDTATLDKITLLDADTEMEIDSTATFNDSTRVLTLQLASGLTYGKDYIVNINGLKTADGVVTSKEASNIRFTNDLLAEDFLSGENVKAVPAAYAGEYATVTLAFTSAVDISNSKITVSDSKGNALYSEATLTGNTLTVKYLNDTDYINNHKLTISKEMTVADCGNQPLSEDYVYEFKTPSVFTVSSLTASKSADNKLTTSATLKNHFFDIAPTVSIMHLAYDSEGRLVNSFIETATVPKDNTGVPVSLNAVTVNPNAEKLCVYIFSASMKNLFTQETAITAIP